MLRQLLSSLLESIHSLNECILSVERSLTALCQQQPKYKVLMTIPGIGPLIAAAFLSEVTQGSLRMGGNYLPGVVLFPDNIVQGAKTAFL